MPGQDSAPLRPYALALLCGLVPIAATHAAWWLNLVDPAGLAAEFRCLPYWDGCVSVSRAVRSGPGLPAFRALMLPTAAVLALTWMLTGRWLALLRPERRGQALRTGRIGIVGAVFLVLYLGWLGTEGDWSAWLRRYGVTFYFGLTALAQLFTVYLLWPLRHGPMLRAAGRRRLSPLHVLFALVCAQWAGGLLSVAKRAMLADPALVDRVENVIEWWFALALSAAFLVLGVMMRASAYRLSDALPGKNADSGTQSRQ